MPPVTTPRRGYQAVQVRYLLLSPEHMPPAGLPIIGRVVAGAPMLIVKHLARDPKLHRL
jgi:hypothetical protein